MKQNSWMKAAKELLDKSLLNEDEKKEMLLGLTCAKKIRDIAEKQIAKNKSVPITETSKDLYATANDAIAQLIILSTSGKLVLNFNGKTGDYSFSTCDIPIEEELKVLTGKTLSATHE